MEEIWSNTDFPYMCLKDEIRTKAFREAIKRRIKKGDVVVEIGAGSGILSMFAAEFGAKHVYAVEIEHSLADALRKSIKFNGLDKVITVVEGDVFKVDLPKKMDVLIAELIETGLMDELQVPAINHLKNGNVVDGNTRYIPAYYKTNMQLVYSDNIYYGYKVVAPKHEWPFYSKTNANWWQTSIVAVSNVIEVCHVDFSELQIEERVEKIITFKLNKGKTANGLRISGIITLVAGIELGPTNALNGDKILELEPISGADEVKLKVSYKMGGGLGLLKVTRATG